MKGQILDFNIQSNSGNISGSDGNRYSFSGEEWKANSAPTRGMQVDFISEDGKAKDIFLAVGSSGQTSKNKLVAGLLGILLGGLGIHKFYLGFTRQALIFLITNTIGWLVTWIVLGIPNMILGIIGLIEGIIYLTKTDEEFEQTYIIEKKKWF